MAGPEKAVQPVEIVNSGLRWQTIAKSVRELDQEKIREAKEDVDTLLVFSGLFSAVLSAFLVETYTRLLPDKQDEMISLLRAIATQNYTITPTFHNATPAFLPNDPFEVPEWALRVNGLWFASLIISLSTASLGMLVKSWLREYLALDTEAPRERLRARYYREPAMKLWKVYEIGAILPLLLQIALGLFFVGLCFFTASVNRSVGLTSLPLVTAWAFFLLMTIIAPIVWPRCPFKVHSLTQTQTVIRKLLYRTIQAIKGTQKGDQGPRKHGDKKEGEVLSQENPEEDSGNLEQHDKDSEEDEYEEDILIQKDTHDVQVLVSADTVMADDNLINAMNEVIKQRSGKRRHVEIILFVQQLIKHRSGRLSKALLQLHNTTYSHRHYSCFRVWMQKIWDGVLMRPKSVTPLTAVFPSLSALSEKAYMSLLQAVVDTIEDAVSNELKKVIPQENFKFEAELLSQITACPVPTTHNSCTSISLKVASQSPEVLGQSTVADDADDLNLHKELAKLPPKSDDATEHDHQAAEPHLLTADHPSSPSAHHNLLDQSTEREPQALLVDNTVKAAAPHKAESLTAHDQAPAAGNIQHAHWHGWMQNASLLLLSDSSSLWAKSIKLTDRIIAPMCYTMAPFLQSQSPDVAVDFVLRIIQRRNTSDNMSKPENITTHIPNLQSLSQTAYSSLMIIVSSAICRVTLPFKESDSVAWLDTARILLASESEFSVPKAAPDEVVSVVCESLSCSRPDPPITLKVVMRLVEHCNGGAMSPNHGRNFTFVPNLRKLSQTAYNKLMLITFTLLLEVCLQEKQLEQQLNDLLVQDDKLSLRDELLRNASHNKLERWRADASMLLAADPPINFSINHDANSETGSGMRAPVLTQPLLPARDQSPEVSFLTQRHENDEVIEKRRSNTVLLPPTKYDSPVEASTTRLPDLYFEPDLLSFMCESIHHAQSSLNTSGSIKALAAIKFVQCLLRNRLNKFVPGLEEYPSKLADLSGIPQKVYIALIAILTTALRAPDITSLDEEDPAFLTAARHASILLLSKSNSSDIISIDDELVDIMCRACEPSKSPLSSEASISFIKCLINRRLGGGDDSILPTSGTLDHILDLQYLPDKARARNTLTGFVADVIEASDEGCLDDASPGWFKDAVILLLSRVTDPKSMTAGAVAALRRSLNDRSSPGYSALVLADTIIPSLWRKDPFVPISQHISRAYEDSPESESTERLDFNGVLRMYHRFLLAAAGLPTQSGSGTSSWVTETTILLDTLRTNTAIFPQDTLPSAAVRSVLDDAWSYIVSILQIESSLSFDWSFRAGTTHCLMIVLEFAAKIGKEHDAAKIFSAFWGYKPNSEKAIEGSYFAILRFASTCRRARAPDELMWTVVRNAFTYEDVTKTPARSTRLAMFENSQHMAEEFSKDGFADIWNVYLDMVRFCHIHLQLYDLELSPLSSSRPMPVLSTTRHLTTNSDSMQSKSSNPSQVDNKANSSAQESKTSSDITQKDWSNLWLLLEKSILKYWEAEGWNVPYSHQYWHDTTIPIEEANDVLEQDRKLADECLSIMERLEAKKKVGSTTSDGDSSWQDSATMFPDGLVKALGRFLKDDRFRRYPRLVRLDPRSGFHPAPEARYEDPDRKTVDVGTGSDMANSSDDSTEAVLLPTNGSALNSNVLQTDSQPMQAEAAELLKSPVALPAQSAPVPIVQTSADKEAEVADRSLGSTASGAAAGVLEVAKVEETAITGHDDSDPGQERSEGDDNQSLGNHEKDTSIVSPMFIVSSDEDKTDAAM